MNFRNLTSSDVKFYSVESYTLKLYHENVLDHLRLTKNDPKVRFFDAWGAENDIKKIGVRCWMKVQMKKWLKSGMN